MAQSRGSSRIQILRRAMVGGLNQTSKSCCWSRRKSDAQVWSGCRWEWERKCGMRVARPSQKIATRNPQTTAFHLLAFACGLQFGSSRTGTGRPGAESPGTTRTESAKSAEFPERVSTVLNYDSRCHCLPRMYVP